MVYYRYEMWAANPDEGKTKEELYVCFNINTNRILFSGTKEECEKSDYSDYDIWKGDTYIKYKAEFEGIEPELSDDDYSEKRDEWYDKVIKMVKELESEE
jgi:hypothetical protein